MNQIWTLSKPILVELIRIDRSRFHVKAVALRVVEETGFPENGLQRVMVDGVVYSESQSQEVWPIDFNQDGQGSKLKVISMEVKLANVLAKSTTMGGTRA